MGAAEQGSNSKDRCCVRGEQTRVCAAHVWSRIKEKRRHEVNTRGMSNQRTIIEGKGKVDEPQKDRVVRGIKGTDLPTTRRRVQLLRTYGGIPPKT